MKDCAGVGEAVRSRGLCFDSYNQRRVHQALDYRTPAAGYAERDNATVALSG